MPPPSLISRSPPLNARRSRATAPAWPASQAGWSWTADSSLLLVATPGVQQRCVVTRHVHYVRHLDDTNIEDAIEDSVIPVSASAKAAAFVAVHQRIRVSHAAKAGNLLAQFLEE